MIETASETKTEPSKETYSTRRIARVFPSRTRATPTDALAFFDAPGLFPPEVDEVHISVTFSWDLKRAEWLARQWEHIAPVEIGGPATGAPGGAFEPGTYIAQGYTITSRGCPNRCWYCDVWRREGVVRELPIKPGSKVFDDNLLACSDEHIKAVFAMLKTQDREKVEFCGGLEAARLQDWHVDLIRDRIATGRAYAQRVRADPQERVAACLASFRLVRLPERYNRRRRATHARLYRGRVYTVCNALSKQERD